MKRMLVLLGCFGLTIPSFGQSVINLKFSAPQLLNPALTGVNKESQFNFSALNMFGRFNNTYADYSQYSTKLHGGIGIYSTNSYFNLYSSEEFIQSNALGLSYAYQNNINKKWHYSLGSSFEIGNTKWAYNSENGRQLDLGFKVGGLIYTESFFASLSYGHSNFVNKSTPNYSTLQTNLGYKFKPFKSLDLSFTPSINYTYQYGYGQIGTNLEAQYKKLHLGIGYSSGRPNASIGYDFNKFRLNYNMSNFGGITNDPIYTTHQLSFKFKLKNKSNNSNRTSFNMNLF